MIQDSLDQRSTEKVKSTEFQPPVPTHHVNPSKKVAKVKPHPRNIEHVDTEIESQELSIDTGGLSVEPNVTARVTIPLTKIPVASVSPVSESGTYTECTQLTRQLWNLRDEMVEFRQEVMVVLNSANRQLKRLQCLAWLQLNPASRSRPQPSTQRMSSTITSPTVICTQGLDYSEIDDFSTSLNTFILTIKNITNNLTEVEEQFRCLSAGPIQRKVVLYSKVLHAWKYVVHDHLSILYSLHQLISTIVHLLASSSDIETSLDQSYLATCRLSEAYNSSLQCAFRRSMTSRHVEGNGRRVTEFTSKVKYSVASLRSSQNLKLFLDSDRAWLHLSLKPIYAANLVNLHIQKRIVRTSEVVTEVLNTNFLHKLKTVEETGMAKISKQLRLDSLTTCTTDEEQLLEWLLSGIVEASLSGQVGIEKSRKNLRKRLVNYFHDKFWLSVGKTAKELLLWGPSNELLLSPLQTFTNFRQALVLTVEVTRDQTSELLSALAFISRSLHSFTIMLTWDHKFSTCVEVATKFKRPEQSQVLLPTESSQWTTIVGEHVADLLAATVLLMDGFSQSSTPSSPSHETALKVSYYNVDAAEEECLCDEGQIFFKLEATFSYFVAWVTKRSKAWLNCWTITQFLAISQDTTSLGQLLYSRKSILITRECHLNSTNTSMRLTAWQRHLCANDFRTTLELLQELPKLTLEDVTPTCETLSLATLGSCMPPSRYWENTGNGIAPSTPSPYVNMFIGRVIEPVIEASIQFLGSGVQEAIGQKVVNAASEAWLQYILQKKLRFSEWGAVQLLRDFIFLRQWINETALTPEAKKAILSLEVLKQCEGVAYLLLHSPGDVLGVGKSAPKPRRRSSFEPSGNASNESSPSTSNPESPPAEDDIPPEMYVPNQQMWLQLRFRPTTLSFICC